ncbi:MAG: sporulation protein YqfD [bacterium]|nr:sporulation protein YqfD [bacterium]
MNWWPRFTGDVRIRVEGRYAERFVNLCVSRRFAVTGIRRSGSALRLWLPVTALRSARELAREAGVRLRLEGRRGIPFVLRELRPHRGLLIGAVLAVLALNGLASVVWFVQVEGASRLSPAEILAAVDRAGLRPGRVRHGLDLNAIERRTLQAIDDLSWVGIEVRGIVATVEVVEKDPPAPLPPDPSPRELVAARDGVIHTLLVFQGEAVVAPGQTVASGDLVIRAPPPAPGRLPHAGGLVRARVWYTGEAAVPLVWTYHRVTGRVHARWALCLAGWEIVLGGKAVPFGQYESHRQTWRPPGWRNGDLPVELLRDTYYELEPVHRVLSPDEAALLAERLAHSQAVALVPLSARVMERQAERIDLPGQVWVKVTIEVLEDIGLLRLAASIKQ